MTAGTAGALTRCVGDPERFLRETWSRHSHLQAPAIGAGDERPPAEGFPDLLTLADVDTLLSSAAVRVPFFRLVKAGSPLPVESYTREARLGGVPAAGIADPARVFKAFEDGATIVLQGLQRYWPALTAFCRELEQALGHPCQVNAYITPPGSQGLNVHSDPHDVFVLQAFGRKSWKISPAPGEDPADGPREVALEPGATLYLPLGTPHAARTQDTISGHLTIGVLATTWQSLLEEVFRRLSDDANLDERLPAGYPRDREGFAAEVRQRMADLAASMEKLDPAELSDTLIDGFLTSRQPLLAGNLVDRTRLRALTDDSLVRRRLGSICELRPGGDGRIRVLLGDRELRMPATLTGALGVVIDNAELRPRDLARHLDAESRQVLISRLVQEGLLEVAPPA